MSDPEKKKKNQKRKHLFVETEKVEKVEEKKVEPEKVAEEKVEKVEPEKVEKVEPEKVAEEKVEKVEEEEIVEPSPTKRVRITKEEEEEETPSFFRGGFVKPLLLAGLASASFYVNHLYKTTSTPTPKKPAFQTQQKKKQVPPSKHANFMLSNQNRPTPSIVPGFSM